MINSLPRCDQCNSPVTDSIETEIENHGKVKLSKYTRGSWICNDCMTERAGEEKLSATSTIQDDSNNKHHEHIGAASKSDVSPNTPTADEANL
ncbi:MAG: hypothetical protein ACRD47_05345 [Nitrososphaeraceae archaeon]